MTLTHISIKVHIKDYKFLKSLANQKHKGNLSKLIRTYLPKRTPSLQEEFSTWPNQEPSR